MKRHVSILGIVIVVAYMVTGCAWFRDDTPMNLSDGLVEFPSSIQPSSPAASFLPRATASEVIDSVHGIYTPVRDNYNKLAIDAIDFIAEILDSIDQNIFGNQDLVEYLEANGSVVLGDNAERWQITASGNDYTVAGWTFYDPAWAQSIYIAFTTLGAGISGSVVLSAESADAGRTMYEAEFTNTDPMLGRVTELRAINLDYQSVAVWNIPTSLWVKAYDDGDSFQVAASVFYTDVDLESGDLKQDFMDVLNMSGSGTEQVSTFVAPAPGVEGAYMYRGSFETGGTERGKIDLGLVPATYPGADYFGNYSLGSIYTEAIGGYVAGSAALISDINAIPAVDPDLGASPTPAEVMAALEQVYAADPGNTDLAGVIFATLLTNPVYFEAGDSDSFVGTEDLQRPGWSDSLPAYGLTIEVDQSELAALSIDFPVAMGATPPDTTF